MKISNSSQPNYEYTTWLDAPTRQQQPLDPWSPFHDQAHFEDEEAGELFDEPLLQQLFQSWAPPAPQPAYQRAVQNWPQHNQPIQRRSQPIQNRPAPAQPAQTAQTTPARSAPSSTTLNLPPRPEGSLTGKEFLESTRGLDRTQREARILQEIQRGNVPDFARQMREIQVNSNGHSGTLRVMPDYLAIGSNDDFVRIPMDAKTAQKIADQTGTSLPTTKIVDEVYKQADTKLTPQPLPAGAQMMSNDYYQRHNNLVEDQMSQRGAQHGQLTAGHQKDLVISNRLTQHPDRVAIYGWHQPNGKPIQGLSTVHESTYADYSHGVRLVGGTMLVDGQERPVSEVLQDPALAGLISSEGAIRDPRVPRT
ncbi:MAG: hypothetical protein J0I12_11960 [Candidatus Eremiobacteraeota bacterium]|nr:hypothetical protein [Candidatus Eremiobacteraeota bacterium]